MEKLIEGQFKETKESVIQKAKKMTFDDLWDWRLKQGNKFIGKERKESMASFGLGASSPVKPLLMSSREAKEEDKRKKEENKNNLTQEDVEESEEDSQAPDHQIKKNLKDLENWAGLTEEQIKTTIQKKKRKEAGGGLIPDPRTLISQKSREMIEFEQRNEFAKKNATVAYNFKDPDSFEISDDEDVKVKKSAREREALANKKLNDEIKEDEDFKKIGDVIIGQNDFNLMRKVNQKDNKASATALFDNFLGNNTATPVAALPAQNKQKEEKKEEEEEKKEPIPEKREEDMTEAEKERAKLHAQLEKNQAFKIIQKLMTSPDNPLEKLGANKKKKKRDDDDEKLTPEQEEEEKIANYYRKIKYDFLKLEAGYKYDIIPPPAFNSIMDVLPKMVQNVNQRALDKKIKDQELIKLNMTYTMTELKKKKQKKKKLSKKEREKEANMKKQRMQNIASTTTNLMNSTRPSSSLQSNTVESISEYGSDGESSAGDDLNSQFNTKKGSEAKRARKEFFLTNEKFINRKPFPLVEGKRKNHILKAMTDTSGNFKVESNKVDQSTVSTRSKSKGVADFNADIQAISDKFVKDEEEDQKDEETLKLKDSHHDYKVLYLSIRANDTTENSIEKYNWSGNNLMPPYSFTLSQTDKTIDALNHQKLDIWLSGCKGFILTSKRYCREFVDSSFINTFLMVSVFLNTLILGADGLAPDSWADAFTNMNLAFTIIFTCEMLLKMYGLGLKRYSQDAFNIFDCFVVILSLVELVINYTSGGGNSKSATSGFRAVRIFRIFRVLRVTRLLRSLRFMKVIIDVIKNTAEQFAYIIILMFLFIFIFTLLGTQVFGGTFKFDVYSFDRQRYNFDSFSNAFFTVFTILTIENWNGVLINCLRSSANSILAVIYLIIWIFIGNYIFVNLFLSILLDGFGSSDVMKQIEEIEHETKELERAHKKLIEREQQKRISEQQEKEKAIEEVLLIIDPKKHQDKKKIKKNQATYLVARDSGLDHPTLSEELDLKKIIEGSENQKTKIIDPYDGVDCIKSLYYFTQKNPIRLFCAKVVSHP